MLGCGGFTLFECFLRAISDLAFFKKLEPPCKTSILVLFARNAAIFDLLGAESSSDMKWKAKAKEGQSTFSNDGRGDSQGGGD